MHRPQPARQGTPPEQTEPVGRVAGTEGAHTQRPPRDGQVASDAGDESSVGYYLQRLASLARQRDDPDRAVRLLAAADALLQASGTGWLLAYAAPTPSDDDILPGLRSRMGDATFQQAWAQGAVMGRQRAVEYALQE